MTAPPIVGPRIIEALLEGELAGRLARSRAEEPSLVLVHGRYDMTAPTEFTIQVGEKQCKVTVSDQTSVLGVVDAWQGYQERAGSGGAPILVITTGVDDRQLGSDIRGHAIGRIAHSVDRAEIVKQRFGAAELDPRIRLETWLVDALLDAEPAEGWRGSDAAAGWRRSGGAVLTRDAAVRALIEARLGLSRVATRSAGSSGAVPDPTLDADALLAWSRTAPGPGRYAELPAEERAGIAAWLREAAGESVPVLMALAAAGRARDAMPLGVIGAVLTDPSTSSDAAVSVGGLFAGVAARPDELRALTAAVQGTLTRWITDAETGRTGRDDARQKVMAVLDRADELTASAGLGPALAGDRFLPSGLNARMRTLAAMLTDSPAAADEALAGLKDHLLAGLSRDRCEVAEMAVRVRHWLDSAIADRVTSVAAGVRQHANSWGWVDRALASLWAGDPARDPVVGQKYRELYEAAAARRTELDEAFAARLATWTNGASTHAPDGCLLLEDVLTAVAVPLAAARPPVLLVLDGMSSAVATQFGEELTRQGWTEATRTPGLRQAAVSLIPSITSVSRASLLAGAPTRGGQTAETDGFTAFWRRHRRPAVLFHQAAVAGGAGHRLAQPLLDALAGDDVMGVVLNTIDDALDHGKEGFRTGWRLSDITYLPDMLDAARGYDRPVVLVADHGHILDRSGPGTGPVAAPGAEAARWRTGAPEAGEIELAGPRVLEGGGRIVVPWREDIRYTPRRAGYHGGAALSEMTVPVLVMLPSPELLPTGWTELPPEEAAPAWWTGQAVAEATPPAVLAAPVRAAPSRKRRAPQPDAEPLFPVGESVPAETAPATLGARVVDSPIYSEQKKHVRKAPDQHQVAAVIDALAAAGGTLSPSAVNAAAAAAGGRTRRTPEGFVITLQRLLNVEGYLIVGLVDSGRTVRLDVVMLAEQFEVQA